jgi:NADPH-dependent 2,4-dienoyl-CoA reductase/sulfur reductase-like enzyme
MKKLMAEGWPAGAAGSRRVSDNFAFPGGNPGSCCGHMTADFLVIGAGIAGLSFALRAAKHGSVIAVTKGEAYE